MTVLVLNQDWQVLAVARVPRAIALIFGGKAELLEQADDVPIRSASCSFARPSVIRLMSQVKRPRPRVRYSRTNVFRRDAWACQYCGVVRRDLTIDHVLPRHRGGPDTWENTVTACFSCNHRKGGRTPEEARMKLRRAPYEPRLTSYLHLTAGMDRPDWHPYLAV